MVLLEQLQLPIMEQYGVRCNAVAPGWIDTPLNDDYIKSFGDERAFREKLGQNSSGIGRTGTPEEVANLVWLACIQRGLFCYRSGLDH